MNRKLKFLTGVSLKKKIKSKWFVIVNIFLLVVIAGLINIDTIINFFGGTFGEDTKIILLDQTNEAGTVFTEALMASSMLDEFDNGKLEVEIKDITEKKAIKLIDNNKTIVVVLSPDSKKVLKAKIIAESYLEMVLQQQIMGAVNVAKSSLAMVATGVESEVLMKINAPVVVERVFLDESKSEAGANMEMVMSIVFPIVILPFFMLIIFLVQMIGAEINEEKTTRGMEIIISNVSPKTHFLSKILAGNAFVLIQGSILLLAGMIGFGIRKLTATTGGLLPEGIDVGSFWSALVASGMASKLIYIIPLVLILLALSFIAYSLLAGILASMTTSMEDFQQLQTPIILVLLGGYYLSMLSPLFEGSIFIRVVSYIPFLSALLSPALLLLSQIGLIDILISMVVLIGLIYLMITYGLKIYKVGILNYSTSKLWLRMVKAVKEE